MHARWDHVNASEEGLTEQSQDKTAPMGLMFFHAKEGQPLSTPWQVATARSVMLAERSLAEGFLLDCACGSGLQLAAHASVLKRPMIGIELDPQRAQATAKNLQIVANHSRSLHAPWFEQSVVISGDGTHPKGALEVGGIELVNPIALLHLDPARPRNSRTHGLEEMAPRLDDVFAAWAPYFAPHPRGPGLLLDLSPRLTPLQQKEVEGLVDAVWPNVERTWVWTSRGRGRVDRLALWLGTASKQGIARQFVRIPPTLGTQPMVLEASLEGLEEHQKINTLVHPPKRGEYVSILDAALLESGLMGVWLSRVSKEPMNRWASVEGRRPQLHHDKRLRLDGHDDEMLVQATGRVVELIRDPLDETGIDRIVEIAIENNMSAVTLRLNITPELHPRMQGSLDRQLARRHGGREGFLARHPIEDVLLLCVCESDSKN